MNIRIKIDPEVLTNAVSEKLEILRNPKPVLRIVAFDVLSMMTARIHEQGKAADGNRIGDYSNQYLKMRMKKYKRSGDRKVIMSLTRQMENNWAVIETDEGWGIGFLNPFNVNKMKWNEEHYKKAIAELTDEERDYAVKRANELIAEYLSK